MSTSGRTQQSRVSLKLSWKTKLKFEKKIAHSITLRFHSGSHSATKIVDKRFSLLSFL